MTIVMPEQASHFYWPDGSPCHSVPYADKKRAGEYRNTTVADCRKLGLFPSVTNILGIIAKPGLSAWKEEQSILASLTLPQRAGETLDAFAHRVVEDMKAQTKEAARKGSEIHKTIENHLLGKAINLIPQVKPAIRWLDENVIEVICAERVLVNREQGYAGTVDLICVLRDTGKTTIIDFKGLAIDTPIPTPSGWSLMNDLSVGDVVYGSDGNPCRVIAKSPTFHRKCYKITFDDASSIVCDEFHLWEFWRTKRKDSKPKLQVMEAKDLYAEYSTRPPKSSGYCISNSMPLACETRDLPIHPYVLGYWLGDGSVANGEIYGGDTKLSVPAFFESQGFPCTFYKAKSGWRCNPKGLAKLLRLNGLIKNKHVPPMYLRAPTEDRLLLLQGLMDSDGTWHKVRNEAVFGNTSKVLADAVNELAVSLGWKAYQYSYMARGFGIEVMNHVVKFRPYGFTPFLLNHRNRLLAEAWVPKTNIAKRRGILSMEEVESVPTQCIQVDSPNSLYLCGRQMVPTHNTQSPKCGKFTVYPEWGLQLEAYRAAYEGDAPLEHIDLMSLVVSSEEPQDILCHLWDQEGGTRRWEAFKAAHTLWKWSKNL